MVAVLLLLNQAILWYGHPDIKAFDRHYSTVSFVLFTNMMFMIGWLVLAVLALWELRTRRLPSAVTGVWVLIILLFPLIGAILFWVFAPTPA